MIDLKKILCPVDLSELSMLALGYAQAVATRYGASLTIVHIMENPYSDVPGDDTGAFSFGDIVNLYREEREEHILDVLRKKGASTAKFDIIFREGVPYRQIIEIAREVRADMILLSAWTRKTHEILAGGTTERVVRLAPCPVLSVRTDDDPEQREKLGRMDDLMDTDSAATRTILLPTDFSEHSTLAANYAISLAREYEADMIVLHVLERVAEFTPVMGGELSGYEAVSVYYDELCKTAHRCVEDICKRAEEHGVKAHRRVIPGNPRYEISAVARSEPIDLIVIGTHGRRGFSRFIHGSVAEAVVHHAPCSVLSVKRPEHDFITLD